MSAKLCVCSSARRAINPLIRLHRCISVDLNAVYLNVKTSFPSLPLGEPDGARFNAPQTGLEGPDHRNVYIPANKFHQSALPST